MSNVSAMIGVAQMEHLPSIIARYQENGLYYDEKLADVPGVTIIRRPPNSRSAYWVYTFLVRERDRLFKRLREEGVQSSKVHLRNDLYAAFGNRAESLPGVELFSNNCLSIPSGWWVTKNDRVRIADMICQEAQ